MIKLYRIDEDSAVIKEKVWGKGVIYFYPVDSIE